MDTKGAFSLLNRFDSIRFGIFSFVAILDGKIYTSCYGRVGGFIMLRPGLLLNGMEWDWVGWHGCHGMRIDGSIKVCFGHVSDDVVWMESESFPRSDRYEASKASYLRRSF